MNEFIEVSTESKNQLINITDKVEEVIEKSKVENGLVLIFSLHTSSAILVNENEEGLKKDWFGFLEKITSGMEFSHDKLDNNACAHLASGLIGNEKVFPIEKGKMVKGTWQSIFLAEFDGPRQRKVLIKVIGE